MSDFDSNLEDEISKQKSINTEWDANFKRVTEIYLKAKSLEKTDIYEAINLYESIKNTNYGKFDSVGRLIILYRKTRQREKEIEHVRYKIEETQNDEYNRMAFLQNKYPNESNVIKFHYDNKMEYLTPDLVRINFHKNLEKLISLLNKLTKT